LTENRSRSTRLSYPHVLMCQVKRSSDIACVIDPSDDEECLGSGDKPSLVIPLCISASLRDMSSSWTLGKLSERRPSTRATVSFLK